MKEQVKGWSRIRPPLRISLLQVYIASQLWPPVWDDDKSIRCQGYHQFAAASCIASRISISVLCSGREQSAKLLKVRIWALHALVHHLHMQVSWMTKLNDMLNKGPLLIWSSKPDFWVKVKVIEFQGQIHQNLQNKNPSLKAPSLNRRAKPVTIGTLWVSFVVMHIPLPTFGRWASCREMADITCWCCFRDTRPTQLYWICWVCDGEWHQP